MMNRRTFLLSTAALAACSTQTPDVLKADIQAIAFGLGAVLTDIQAIPGVSISPEQVKAIQGELDIINQDAAQIASAATPNADLVQAIGAAVSALVPLVTPFYAGAPAVAAVMQAALALVPVVLAMVGSKAAAASAPTMTPDQAVAVLRRRGR